MSALLDRRTLPVQVDRRLFALPVSSEAFRIYCWLASQATQEGVAMPSVPEIAIACLSQDYANQAVRERHVREAVDQLQELGLLVKERRTEAGLQTRNAYILLDLYDRQLPEPAPVNAPMGLDKAWVEPLCFILYGHTNLASLMAVNWRHIRSVYAKCRDAGATLEQVQTWYKKVWVKEWPGKNGSRPIPSQVATGVAAYMATAASAQPGTVVVLIDEEEDQ